MTDANIDLRRKAKTAVDCYELVEVLREEFSTRTPFDKNSSHQTAFTLGQLDVLDYLDSLILYGEKHGGSRPKQKAG